MRAVIIAGAPINNYEQIKGMLTKDDFYIFCDSGLRHLDALGVKPNVIVGDFDSFENPHMDVETVVLPTIKDDTDSVHAVKLALERGFKDFMLLGVIGGRLDHTLGNIYILEMLYNRGASGVIVDDYSIMRLVDNKVFKIPDTFSFFSLVNITGNADGITIKNAKYEIKKARIDTEYQYGVSNEVTPGKVAEVSVEKGILLLIEDF